MVTIQTYSLKRLLIGICVAVCVMVFSISGSNELYLTKAGSISIGGFDEGAAEISAFDPVTQRLFVTNTEDNTVDIISISDPKNPTKIASIDCSPFGGGINSVAVSNKLVAIAVEADVKQDSGSIVFFNTDGEYLATAQAGALPDMVTFTHDGKRVLAANEGSPDDSYTNDPEGSITIVDLSGGLSKMRTRQVGFRRFNRYKKNLIRSGVRIYGPGATVAQDLEPEYITVGPYGLFAYVTLQENNAIAIVNILRANCVWIFPLGLKDHSHPNNGFDASNKDKAIAIKNWPVSGMYLPDAIASYKYYGLPLLVTANEGDSRDYDGYSEEERVKDIVLDPAVFPDASELMEKKNLGRLKISTALSQINEHGEFKRLFSYGGRSFSIFTPWGQLIYDSGDDFEKITASIYPDNFNSTNNENGSFDNRSDDKGPEPEALTIGKISKKTFAFIGMERIGGIMVYDITNPYRVEFITYVNSRNFDADIETPEAGDLGVEGLVFVDAFKSPTKKPLLIASNEVSGTVTIFEIHIREYPEVSE